MSRIRIAICVLMVLPSFASPVARGATVTREPVSFRVTNPLDPLRTYTVRGTLVRPEGCVNSVVLAMHGLSYGAWAWDFPLRPGTYSVAQALAERGYATVTIDELGYGESAGTTKPDNPNGYTLTVQSYAVMTAQIVRQLRAGTYRGPSTPAFPRVGLIGHSAGSEIVELAAGLYPKLADVLIATAYTHEPFVNNQWLLRQWIPNDNVQALQDDYVYFENDPVTRAKDFYVAAEADADVIQLDTSLANLTPSGEILSIGSQPSRWVIGLIRIPVLLVLAGKDELFPARFGANEMSLFLAATDKTLLVAPRDGHTFMLHRDAPVINGKIADWLAARPNSLPAC